MKWKWLLIHHTATGPRETVESISAMHQRRGWSDIGYHYLLMRDVLGNGHLKAGRPDTRPGAHCPGWNRVAIGMSVVGYFHPGSPLSEHMSEELYQDVLAAATHLCRKYGFAADQVKFHRECSAKGTACPGSLFPMTRLRADLKG